MGAFDANQFGVNDSDGADDDKGEAMKRDTRYDGAPAQDQEYEGMKAHECVSAAQMNAVGRE